MRIVKTVVLGVAVGILCAVAAAPALAAAPRWEGCKAVSGGPYEDEGCTIAKEKGGFEWAAITETEEVTSSGTLQLEDSEPAAGGAVEIECKSTGVGTVGAEGSDSISKVTTTGCKFIKAGECEESAGVTATAINLGWSTKLEETSEEVRDGITSLASGKEPGWAVKCTVDGIIEITDECVANTTTNLTDNSTTGAIEAEFESKGAVATCSSANKKSGHVRGTMTIKARNGKGLQAGPPLFKVTSNRENKPLKVTETALFIVENLGPNGTKLESFLEARYPKDTTWAVRNAAQLMKAKECEEKAYASKEECFYEVEYLKEEKGSDTLIVRDKMNLGDSKAIFGK
jgi:hypothetical protein